MASTDAGTATRIDDLRAWMASNDLEAAYITRPVSIAYLTGVHAEPYERLMALAIKPPAEAILFYRAATGLAQDLRSEERHHGLPRTRRPDPGLARSVTRWAEGGLLSAVLSDCEVAPGDFVRNIRQLLDLLRQLAQVAPSPQTADAAELAVSLLRRGVVAANDPADRGSATDPAPRS